MTTFIRKAIVLEIRVKHIYKKNAKRDHLISSQILFTKEFIQSLHMTQFPATCTMRIRI